MHLKHAGFVSFQLVRLQWRHTLSEVMYLRRSSDYGAEPRERAPGD